MRDIRILNHSQGQQIESDEVLSRLGKLEHRNIGASAKIGFFDTGKALITSGLRVIATSGMTVKIPTGAIFQREIDVTACIQTSDQTITMDAASGSPRIDIIEGQISTVTDKTDYARIGTVSTGTGGGSVVITNEEIKRDLKYYLSVRKQTGTTTPTAAAAGSLTGLVAIPGTIDLSEHYLINISYGEDGNWIEVDCRGATPNATTRAEIMAAINAAVGATMASAGSGDAIVLTGPGTGVASYFSIKPPVTNADVDALEVIFGINSGGIYRYEYRGTNGWVKLAEIDIGASTTTITDLLIRNIDQKSTWASEEDEVMVHSPIYEYLNTYIASTAPVLPPVGTALMWDSEELPDGGAWQWREGASLSRAGYPDLFAKYYIDRGTVTISGPATPAVFALAGHDFGLASCVSLATTGALWTGFAINTNYFVIPIDVDTFWLATSADNARAGTKIASSGSQSGTHTLYSNPHGINGANSFYLPDGDGLVMRQTGDLTINGRTKTGVGLGAAEEDGLQGHQHLMSNVPFNLDGVVNPGINCMSSQTNKNTGSPVTDDTNGTPRTGLKTNTNEMGVRMIVRVI